MDPEVRQWSEGPQVSLKLCKRWALWLSLNRYQLTSLDHCLWSYEPLDVVSAYWVHRSDCRYCYCYCYGSSQPFACCCSLWMSSFDLKWSDRGIHFVIVDELLRLLAITPLRTLTYRPQRRDWSSSYLRLFRFCLTSTGVGLVVSNLMLFDPAHHKSQFQAEYSICSKSYRGLFASFPREHHHIVLERVWRHPPTYFFAVQIIHGEAIIISIIIILPDIYYCLLLINTTTTTIANTLWLCYLFSPIRSTSFSTPPHSTRRVEQLPYS